MEYKLSEQELKDLMHRSWLKAKKFYSGKTDEYFYDYFESEKKQLHIHVVSQQSELLFCKCGSVKNGGYGCMRTDCDNTLQAFMQNNCW